MTNSSRRQRKLYKDPVDRKIAGVASGVAKYFDIDTTLVRAVWAVLALGGVGILLYLILWAVLEDEPADLEALTSNPDLGATHRDEMTAAETNQGGEPPATDEGGDTDPEVGNARSG